VLTVAPPDARGHQDTVRDCGYSATVRSREQDRLPSAFTEYRSANPLLQRTLPLAGAARQWAQSKRDATAPGSKWGNPFKPAIQGDAAAHAVAVALYRRWLGGQPKLLAALPDLRGRDLVCWCAPLPSHGDVLLELCNSPTNNSAAALPRLPAGSSGRRRGGGPCAKAVENSD
jgi:hypothetical protein